MISNSMYNFSPINHTILLSRSNHRYHLIIVLFDIMLRPQQAYQTSTCLEFRLHLAWTILMYIQNLHILSKYVKDGIKAKRVTFLGNWRARTIIIPSGRAYSVFVASWSLLLVLIQILDNLKAGRFIFTITRPFIIMPKTS